MNGSQSNAILDPAALQSLLQRHRTHLSNTHREVADLKAFIGTLDATIEKQNHEISTLKLEVSHYKESESNLSNQLQSAHVANDRLLASLEKQAQDHAQVVIELESRMRKMETEWRTRFERVSSQLEATQQPISRVQPLPWKTAAESSSHPAHVLREVVLEDQKREERVLQRHLPLVAADNCYTGTEVLRRLLDAANADEGEVGADIRTWRLVLQRIHAVLSDRRGVLGLDNSDSHLDFIVRGRNAFVAEWIQLHRNILRALKAAQTIKGLLSTKTLPSNVQIDRYADLISSILGDVDSQCLKVEESHFTDVDRLLYKLERR